jgi:hypothetical protein
MKLAFNSQAHYTDFSRGYELYCKRSKKPQELMSEKQYRRAIRKYCERLADRIENEGMADLPCGLGLITTALITRKPQFRGKKYIGYGKMDWEKGRYDGNLKAFGMVFLPRHKKNTSIRSFGFVANRRLFKRVKEKYLSDDCRWTPIDFYDDMI